MSPLAPRTSRAGARGRAFRRPVLLRPAAEFWSSVLPPVIDSLGESRTRRLKTAARFQHARLDRRIAGLRALEHGLDEIDTSSTEADPGSATPVEDPYGTTVDGESQVPIPTEPVPPTTTEPPASTTAPPPATTPEAPPPPVTTPPTSTTPPPPATTPQAPPPATTPPVAEQPSTRAFYDVFDVLQPGDFTEDHFPKTSVVNAALEDAGEPRTNRDAMRPVFDRWVHDRIEEGRLTPPTPVAAAPAPAAAPKPITDEVLFTAFDDLDSNDFTKDEPKYPLVRQVQERIPAGYETPTQAVIHAAYDRYPRKRND